MHYLVADIARTITFNPGDVLLSGTPANSRTVYPGDVVEVEVEGLGPLRNHIVDGPAPIRDDVGAQPTETEEVLSTAQGRRLGVPRQASAPTRAALTMTAQASSRERLIMDELGSTSAAGADPRNSRWPAKRLLPSAGRRFGDRLVMALVRLAAVPHTYVLTTRGRKSGQLRSVPVSLVEDGDDKWLVAPYGPVSWVQNSRAEGRVTLSRRGRVGMYAVREVSAAEAGPVLKKYLTIAGATRPYFTATRDSPVEEFVAEAGKHPVFALTEIARPVRPSDQG